MLLQRVVTAVVLLALLVPAMAADSVWPFALLTLLLIAAAVWEWGRLNRVASLPALALGALVLAAGVWAVRSPSFAQVPAAVWWAVCAVWLAIGALVLRAGPPAWLRWPLMARVALGLLVLGFSWLALTGAHRLGVNFLLSVLCLVWVADIGAYAAGRAFGRNKLAPTISPGKSWEGVAGGMLGVLVLAGAWIALIDPRFGVEGASLYARLYDTFGVGGLLVGVMVLAAASVVGDLFESLVKRAAGAKDSSRLLPGHGGVLDRIDALLPVLPLAMALAASLK